MILNVQLINFLPLSHHFTVLMLQTSNGLLQTCRDVSFFCGPKAAQSALRDVPGSVLQAHLVSLSLRIQTFNVKPYLEIIAAGDGQKIWAVAW